MNETIRVAGYPEDWRPERTTIERIALRHVDVVDPQDVWLLYMLLSERTPEQSISHKALPTWHEHRQFVASNPYQAWHFILANRFSEWLGDDVSTVVGSIYLTRQRELGVFIFRGHQRKGYARAAVHMLMQLNPGPFLANINPANAASIRFWESLGFKHIQNTYALEP